MPPPTWKDACRAQGGPEEDARRGIPGGIEVLEQCYTSDTFLSDNIEINPLVFSLLAHLTAQSYHQMQVGHKPS